MSLLSAFRVGVVKNSATAEFLARYAPNVDCREYASEQELLEGAAKKDVLVFVEAGEKALWQMKQQDQLGTYLFDPSAPLFVHFMKAAVRKGDAETAELVREGMEKISDQDKSALLAKWTGDRPENGGDRLIVAMPYDLPPRMFLDVEGRPAGLMADIWRLWSKKTASPFPFCRLLDRESAQCGKRRGPCAQRNVRFSGTKGKICLLVALLRP